MNHHPNEETTEHALETVVRITRVQREQILVYCRRGLVRISGDPEDDDCRFDDESIHQLRHIESIRNRYGLDLDALELVTSLLRDIERLREELRFHLR